MRFLRRRRLPDPVPPTNVRLQFENGDEIPLECVYVGIKDDVHMWEAVIPVNASGHDACRLIADTIPPHSGIGVTVMHDGE